MDKKSSALPLSNCLTGLSLGNNLGKKSTITLVKSLVKKQGKEIRENTGIMLHEQNNF